MDQPRGHRFYRSLRMLTLFSTAALFGSCQSTGPAPIDAAPPAISLPKTLSLKAQTSDGQTKTFSAPALLRYGNNYQARFSPRGDRVLFVSSQRAKHVQAQIYELNLKTKHERRVTFHDGDDASPSYLYNETYFVYASTTDEIKEHPLVIQNLLQAYHFEDKREPQSSDQNTKLFSDRTTASFPVIEALPPSEIYTQRLDGQEFVRRTRSSGFDGDPTPDPKRNRVVASSSRTGHLHLYLIDQNKVQKLTSGNVIDRSPHFSSDGLALTWSRKTLDPETGHVSSQIMLTDGKLQNAVALTSSGSMDLHPYWHPNGKEIIFSSNRDGGTYNLYSVDRSGKCLKRLTQTDIDQLHPAVSPDGKILLFTGARDGQSQIYAVSAENISGCS